MSFSPLTAGFDNADSDHSRITCHHSQPPVNLSVQIGTDHHHADCQAVNQLPSILHSDLRNNVDNKKHFKHHQYTILEQGIKPRAISP